MLKLCSKCKKYKETNTEFSPDKRSTDGRYSACKECRRNYIHRNATRLKKRRSYLYSVEGSAAKKYQNTEKYKQIQKKYRSSEKYKLTRKRYEESGKAKRAYHNSHLKNKYGISLEDKEQLYKEQRGMCALCGSALPDVFKSHMDHNHKTNKIRGLLHPRCNVMVGFVERDESLPEKIINYLKLYQ